MSSIFIKKEIYPDAKTAFNFSLKPLDEIKENCLFVLDANVLLLPFTTDGKSLDEIKRIYEMLVADNRLFIPAQAAREYLDNRATKLTETHKLISDRSSQNFKYVFPHPLLSGMSDYDELEQVEKELKESIKKYQKHLQKILTSIKSWGWDDPVSKMYHEVLWDSVLDDEFIKTDDIEKDLKRRNDHFIPPGYKDAGKDNNQAGDLLIWHEILNLAKEKGKDVVFVSGDNKADWWHQSNKNGIYPRFELVDEFREVTQGKSFHIISLSGLLAAYDASDELVNTMLESEIESALKIAENINSDLTRFEWDALFNEAHMKYGSLMNDEKVFVEAIVSYLGCDNVLNNSEADLYNQFDVLLNIIRNEGLKISLVESHDVGLVLQYLNLVNDSDKLTKFGLAFLRVVAMAYNENK